MSTCLLWFRDNLRIIDNAPVNYAYEHFDEVIPIFIKLEPQYQQEWGFSGYGAQREQFLHESIQDLQDQFIEAQSKIFLFHEEKSPTALIKKLSMELKVDAIVGPDLFSFNERSWQQELGLWGIEHNISCHWLLETTLFEIKDLPFSMTSLPESFTPFRKKIETSCQPHVPLSSAHLRSTSLKLDSTWEIPPTKNSDPIQLGGERSAWERLYHYFFVSKGIASYKETRNELEGDDYSSKFSSYLALGCLSARSIYAELKRFESTIEANESTYWMYFELLWREYFKWISLKHGKDIFLKGGLQPAKILPEFNGAIFESWKNGETKDAFVNANMRYLNATGYMSNRGRQNVASYLIHDLKVDWRAGAAYFERMLIDYDAASNYGNWLYIAGVGNDPRPFRKFNTKMQQEYYDPEGTFVEKWSS